MSALTSSSSALATNKLGCLMQARPSLRKVSEIVKADLPTYVKVERMKIGRQLLSKDIEYLTSMVFVDSGRDEVRAMSQKVWVDTLLVDERRRMYLDPFLRGKKTIKVHFYVAVNARLGPCALVFVTGTTALPPAGYRVSPPYANSTVPGWLRVRGLSYDLEKKMNGCAPLSSSWRAACNTASYSSVSAWCSLATENLLASAAALNALSRCCWPSTV
jgi:hypothetical protein